MRTLKDIALELLDKYNESEESNIWEHGCSKEDFDGLEDECERYYKEIEAADTVEVVRCKDCKYFNPQHRYCEGIGYWFGLEDEWSDNGFCYKGERKETEDAVH